MRLDKFISQAAGISRSQVKKMLKQAAVSLDGKPVSNAAAQVSPHQRITLAGRALSLPDARYFMLNKPAGYVCARRDDRYPTVLELLAEPAPHKLQIAGRLDLDTTGLVLLTDDGAWNHHLTSPRRACTKTYRVELAEPVAEAWVGAFAAGIQLQGESRPTRPARLQLLSPRRALLHLCEGRYHQVKRMFAATGNRVTALHREAVGAIQLDAQLQAGQYRQLTDAEINLAAPVAAGGAKPETAENRCGPVA